MPHRDQQIARSIVKAVTEPEAHPSALQKVPKFFSTYSLDFNRIRNDLFEDLRGAWHIQEDFYRSSFSPTDHDGTDVIQSIGDMGLSGSTFFKTKDSRYLVKSVPRKFEHTFFKNDLLEPYVQHMQINTASLLVRITDFLENNQNTIGTTIGIAPSHHIVMENIRYGQDSTKPNKDDGKQTTDKNAPKWESYDLKPLSYFYPERDVANGAFASDDVLSKLADKFDDKLLLTLDDAEEFKAQLAKDTALLARCKAVDYSLFLVRIPVSLLKGHQASERDTPSDDIPVPPEQPPFVPPDPPSWRTGICSTDGKWLYRAAILDFFWAKHKTTAMMMTGLIKAYNVIDKQGPMSITTDPAEYRSRFLDMCKEMIEIEQPS